MNLADWYQYVAAMEAYNAANIPAGLQIQQGNAQVVYPATSTNAATTNATVVNSQASELLNLAALHNTLLVNGQLIATGTGDNTVSPLPTGIIKKPWLDAPPGALPYDFGGSVALGAVGSSVIVPMTAGQTTYSFVVPSGYDGVINAWSWNFTGGGFVDGSGDLQAQIYRNGAVIRGFDNVTVQKGTIGIPRQVPPIRVFSGDVISLQVNHLANGLLAGNIVGSFVGYFYPNAS